MKKATAFITVAVAAVMLSGCSELDNIKELISHDGTQSTQLSVSESFDEVTEGDVIEEWDENTAPDYYRVVGPAVVDYEVGDDEPYYCDLDDLGRSLCAVANITAEDRAEAKATERADIGHLEPSGWGNNEKVEIPSANPDVPKAYHGWFWNRSHLLADSLGGAAITENMVTGARTQNVGNNDNNGGMAYTENIARDYLDSPQAATCPLYYAVEANYVGEELVPRSTTVNMRSCDGSIDEQVIVYNAAKGFIIDYNVGGFILP